MYSAVLLTALTMGTATPEFCFRGGCHGSSYYGCYGCSGCYGGYGAHGGGYGCYGCWGCYGGYTFAAYGCAGPGCGYHGGCYGGYGAYYGNPYMSGCTGCYGCHGGYSGYGMPVPVVPETKVLEKDIFPPIGPKKDIMKDDKSPEGVKTPPEKKSDDIKKDEPKKSEESQARARVRIEVPEGGRLYVDGRQINVPAGVRVFQTPLLARGQLYFYDVRIEVVRDGRVRSDQQRVIVRSGQEFLVAFPGLAPGETATVKANE